MVTRFFAGLRELDAISIMNTHRTDARTVVLLLGSYVLLTCTWGCSDRSESRIEDLKDENVEVRIAAVGPWGKWGRRPRRWYPISSKH